MSKVQSVGFCFQIHYMYFAIVVFVLTGILSAVITWFTEPLPAWRVGIHSLSLYRLSNKKKKRNVSETQKRTA